MANKLNIADIKTGSLVNKTHDVTVEFETLDDEPVSVDLSIRQLPFAETEALHKRLATGEDKTVVADWIAKSVVDDAGKPMFTSKQVQETFIASLAQAVFDKIMGLDKLKKKLAQTEKSQVES